MLRSNSNNTMHLPECHFLSLLNTSSAIILGELTKCHLLNELSKKIRFTRSRSVASTKTSHWGRKETWKNLSLKPCRSSDSQRKLRLDSNGHVLRIQQIHVL